MQRRNFLSLVGGAAAGWPVTAFGQQSVRRVGVLIGPPETDPQARIWLGAFRQGLERLGWREGGNLRIDYRYAAGQVDRIVPLAKELVTLNPEVIVSQGTAITGALQRETRTIPIVFLTVSDPIGSGYVASLARPGGNLTGLLMYEEGIAGKWLSMLKEVAPQTTHVALIASGSTAYDYYVRAASAAASAVGLGFASFKVGNAADIERAMETLSHVPGGGLVLPPDNTTITRRDLVVALAARLRVPAVYALRIFVAAGGLMSYGTANVDLYRNAAYYIDRILKGARPADLPVQAPTRYETVINLKAARALGLNMPSGMLVAADEVIE